MDENICYVYGERTMETENAFKIACNGPKSPPGGLTFPSINNSVFDRFSGRSATPTPSLPPPPPKKKNVKVWTGPKVN